MRIALIAAVSENGVIGDRNALPWHLPEELAYFRQKTLGKPVIMGRKTFDSMGSKPLPNRLNIILTHSLAFRATGCAIAHSMSEALAVVRASKTEGAYEEIMVIGGAKIYELFLPSADRLYLTVVHQTVSGDTDFPSVAWEDWHKISEQKGLAFTVQVFDRVRGDESEKRE